MKGTAARCANKEQDAGNLAALLASTKERAQNVMIVDLNRNDLARIAELHSVSTTPSFTDVGILIIDRAAVTLDGGSNLLPIDALPCRLASRRTRMLKRRVERCRQETSRGSNAQPPFDLLRTTF